MVVVEFVSRDPTGDERDVQLVVQIPAAQQLALRSTPLQRPGFSRRIRGRDLAPARLLRLLLHGSLLGRITAAIPSVCLDRRAYSADPGAQQSRLPERQREETPQRRPTPERFCSSKPFAPIGRPGATKSPPVRVGFTGGSNGARRGTNGHRADSRNTVNRMSKRHNPFLEILTPDATSDGRRRCSPLW